MNKLLTFILLTFVCVALNAVPAKPGTFSRGIVILVSFSDKAFTKTNAAFTKLLNDSSGVYNQEKGSARQYFANSSNGVYVPQFDVYGSYTLDHTCSYYGGNSSIYFVQIISINNTIILK